MATACPRAASSRDSSTTCFCAPWRPRSLIMNSTRIERILLAFLLFLGHPARAPHLEGEQVPELLRVEPVVGAAALAEVAHGLANLVRVEEAALLDARRRQVLVHEGREVAPQPARERHAEALLRALE